MFFVRKSMEHNKTGHLIDQNKIKKMISAYVAKLQPNRRKQSTN